MFLLIKKIFFFIFDFLIPKDFKLVLCPFQRGEMANSANQVLADYMEVNLKEYKIIRATNRTSLWILWRARYVFLTHGPGDIKFSFWSPRKVVTYVGHGVPLKGFYFTNKTPKFFENLIQRMEVPFYQYVVASSKADQQNLMKCFHKNEKNVLISGLPRNDLLFQSTQSIKKVFPGFSKIILYAPTFRDQKKIKFFPFTDCDLFELNQSLMKQNILLLLRGHINDKTQDSTLAYSHIKPFNSSECTDISYVLGSFDLVITDYSSIYIDFLLTKKPVMFIPYDLADYQSSRGLLYNYQDVTPGPHVHNQKDFILEMNRLLAESDYYLKERIKVKELFHAYDDGGNSKRLLEMVLEKSR